VNFGKITNIFLNIRASSLYWPICVLNVMFFAAELKHGHKIQHSIS